VDAPVIEGFKSRIALHQNRPNPFAPSTIISFALPEGGLVDLTVYDVRGRPVRRLTHEVMVQGLTEVVWDGKDARGRRAGSGVYFYRLETELGVFSRKMLLLR
jgi:flagellar hook assembly protein FlgD